MKKSKKSKKAVRFKAEYLQKLLDKMRKKSANGMKIDDLARFCMNTIKSSQNGYLAFGLHWWAVKGALGRLGYLRDDHDTVMVLYYDFTVVNEDGEPNDELTLFAGGLYVEEYYATQLLGSNQYYPFADDEVYYLFDEHIIMQYIERGWGRSRKQ